MKAIIITLIFTLGSVSFAANNEDYQTRFKNVLSMAEDSLNSSDVDNFAVIMNTAIGNVVNTADSIQKEDNMAALSELLYNAESTLEASVYDKLVQKLERL